MKAIHLLLMGEPGGIEVLVKEIGLQSEQENIMYFIFNGGTIADNMRNHGIPVVIANTPRFKWKKKIQEFVQYCAEEKVDVVVNHFNSPVACFYVYALKQKLPHIKILGYWHRDERDTVKGVKGKFLYHPLIRAMQKRCDKVIAISEFVKKAGMEAYELPEEKIEVIYNAVDLNRFKPSSRIHTGGVMKLIYVGRLIPEKGVHLLLEALSMLPENLPVQTQIVGYGVELEHLKMLAEDLGVAEKTEFLGKRSDVPQLLEQADFFVHPATCQEGFGITLIEAMACGIPCIASRGGAIPEIITDGTGFMFELGAAADLARKIMEAYHVNQTSEYEIMCKSTRKRAERFGISDMVQKLEALY